MAREASLLNFEKSLENLTFNSKPLIDDLTRTAGQLEREGKRVVEIIEARIQKVDGQLNCIFFPLFFCNILVCVRSFYLCMYIHNDKFI